MNGEDLKHSPLCYKWLFIWIFFQILLIVGIIRHGFIPDNTITMELMAVVVLGYAFFIDMSTRIWWDENQVHWQTLDAFTIHPLRRSIRIAELKSVTGAYRAMNYAPGKPFDSFVLSGIDKPIRIFPSLHRREELHALLSLLYEKRPEAFTDPQVIEFMEGGFTDWWR